MNKIVEFFKNGRTWLFIVFFVLVFGLGTGNHFWYEVSGGSNEIKWFAASDESVFSHLKLVLWPWMLCLAISWVLGRRCDIRSYSGGVVGLYVYIVTVLTLFYFYTEGLGHPHNLAADISIFVLGIIFGLTAWAGLSRHTVPLPYEITVGTLGLVGILVWMVTCSYHKCANVYEIPVEP